MWELHPKKSVGPLFLGMSQDAVLDVLGSDFKEFRRTKDSGELVLAFHAEAVQVGIDPYQKANRIIVHRNREVQMDGVQLLGRKVSEVAADLSATSHEFVDYNSGLYCALQNIVLIETDGVVDGIEIYLLP